MKNKQLIIGIDGGATKVSGALLKQIDEYTFTLSGEPVTFFHTENPLFDLHYQPVDLTIQTEETDDPNLKISEEKQALAILQNYENLICEIIENIKNNNPLIGICIPGIKSVEKRGINVAKNGPRIPRFLDVLEHRLKLNGLDHHPIDTLENDSDCCGVGELYAKSGSFRGINNGIFIGSGTGISDAILLNGSLTSFDDIESWMPKTWQLKNREETPIESIISYKGLIDQYSVLTDIPFSKLVKEKNFPEQFLKTENAGSIKSNFISTMSLLIVQRIECLFSKNSSKLFDKIILGLRFIQLLNEIPELLQNISESTKQMIFNSSILNRASKNHYIENNRIVLSKLPHAPVIGAGARAYFNAK